MWLTDVLAWVPNWLWYLILLCAVVYLYGIWPYLTCTIKVPGPKPDPFVGNLVQMNSKGAIDMAQESLQKYGRVHLTWFGRFPSLNIADPDMVKEICIKDFANFTNRPTAVPLSPTQKKMVSALEDDHWKFVRCILSPAFSSGKMRKMAPLIQTCLERLLQNLSEYSKTDQSFEAKKVMGGLTLEVIGAVGFGIDTDVQKDLNDKFLIMAKRVFEENSMTKIPVMVSFFFPFMLPVFEAIRWTADSKEVTDFFVHMLTKAIKERRQQTTNRKDLLQLMLDSSLDDLKDVDQDVDTDALKMKNLNRDKKLTDDEIVSQTVIFLLGGFETTASALSFLAYSLALNPECQEKLIREIDDTIKGAAPTYDNVMLLPYLDMCLTETQRLFPPVIGTTRMCRNSTTIKGVHIPAGTAVLLMGYALQHDETYWKDPEKFDPERFTPEEKAKRNPYVYFPFGLGPRNCVGMRLAQMEAKMAAVAILQKFRFVRAPETEVPLKMKKGTFVQAENGVWLKVQSRH